MANFGFWNVHSAHTETDDRGVADALANLALENSLDILFLIECAIPVQTLLAAFKDGSPTYYSIDSENRFKVIARFDQGFMKRLNPPVPTNRYNLWHLTLPLQTDVILVLVHGFDKRNYSIAKQELLMAQLVSALTFFETRIGHERSVVLGDFNANPFESPIASATGMNAVLSRTIAQSERRSILDKDYPYFYNPMWNLYGDEPFGSAPATFYYRSTDPLEFYWHMLDQVVIRPSLVKMFDFSALRIVTNINGKELRTKRGHPDETRFSDHLPVVFTLDLAEELGE